MANSRWQQPGQATLPDSCRQLSVVDDDLAVHASMSRTQTLDDYAMLTMTCPIVPLTPFTLQTYVTCHCLTHSNISTARHASQILTGVNCRNVIQLFHAANCRPPQLIVGINGVHHKAFQFIFILPSPLKSGAGDILYSGLSVCELVCQSVRPKKLVNTISQKPMKGISPNFGHTCIWYVHVLISFWGEKVKGQGHSR